MAHGSPLHHTSYNEIVQPPQGKKDTQGTRLDHIEALQCNKAPDLAPKEHS